MELEVTWGRVGRIWWAYLWRNLIAMVAALAMGWMIGFVLGFILAKLGASRTFIMVVVAPLGFVMGLGISVIPLKMILGKDFGEFRLVLVSNESQESVG